MNTTIFLVKAHIANTMRLEEGVNCKRIRRADGGEGFVVEGMPEVPANMEVTIPWSNIGTAMEVRKPVLSLPPSPSPTNSDTAPASKTPKKPSRKASKK